MSASLCGTSCKIFCLINACLQNILKIRWPEIINNSTCRHEPNKIPSYTRLPEESGGTSNRQIERKNHRKKKEKSERQTDTQTNTPAPTTPILALHRGQLWGGSQDTGRSANMLFRALICFVCLLACAPARACVCMCVCVCACACMRACMRTYVRACVRARVRMCVRAPPPPLPPRPPSLPVSPNNNNKTINTLLKK